ncbi:PAS domain-containing sensor histidine kinase [Halobaculum sp. CBA1158]|uniref:ATP-binding protein n=1 Tax=Halobaculum sp. CBA1158 TaxID=2904243 RepID=UPI001F2207AA|nr:PAS domain-containing sensor histidine kinase [Halobaculum sp. CBA1158]UIO99561.1 PAS domain-containing sensor histidine kinase [Halobaculum sp. CBA1158]
MTGGLPPAFEDLEESVLLFDADGSPFDQNAAAERFLGYSTEDIGDYTLETLVSGEANSSAAEVRRQLERAADGESVSFEWQIRRANGEHRWVLAMLSPSELSGGGVLAEIRDLTRYKAQDRRLQLLYRVLRHNLRNDMNVIRGHASNLERAIESDDHERQIEVIRRTAERVGGFSESVENLERLVEQDATERYRTNAAELLMDVTEEISEEYPDASIETELEDGIPVSVDEGFRLALEHTLSNALEHNDADDPVVRVIATTDHSGSYVIVRVVDNGPGIPEVELRALEGQNSDVEHGQGLGLWLIKQCTESLGGSVSFEENDPTGTAVVLKIPRIRLTEE